MPRTSRKKTAPLLHPPNTCGSSSPTATYSRLSVLDSGKKDGESIRSQQEMLAAYVAGQPDLVLAGNFVDNGESGTCFLRPAWNDLMAECQAGRIRCIVIKDLSRLGRNYIETGEYLEKILPRLGVRLIALNDYYDSLALTGNEQLVSNLKNLVNDLYAKDISRKSSTALRMKQKQGAFIGTYASYGYQKDPAAKSTIIIDPETAPIVRQIFQWKAAGMGSAQICRRLTAAHILPPSRYRLAKGILQDQRYAESQWSVATVQRILTCQIYLGHMVQGRKRGALYEGGGHRTVAESQWTVVPHTHQPIISQALFDQAGAVMAQRRAAYQASQGRCRQDEKPAMPLKGLLFCADCGKPLTRRKKVSESQHRIYWTYQCPSHNSLLNCPSKSISETALHDAVSAALRAELLKSAETGPAFPKPNRPHSHPTSSTSSVSPDSSTSPNSSASSASSANPNSAVSSTSSASHIGSASSTNSASPAHPQIRAAERQLRRLATLQQERYDDYAAGLITQAEYQLAATTYSTAAHKRQQQLETIRQDQKQDHRQGQIQGQSQEQDQGQIQGQCQEQGQGQIHRQIQGQIQRQSQQQVQRQSQQQIHEQYQELTAPLAQALIERIEISSRNQIAITFTFRDEYQL